MKAGLLYKLHDGVRVEDTPAPVLDPNSDDVLIKMHVCAVGAGEPRVALDDPVTSSARMPKVNLPHIMGRRGGAGVVCAIGKLVKRINQGDRVIIRYNDSCGECRFCRGGREHLCTNARVRGGFAGGFMAEYAMAAERYVNRLPAEVTFHDALPIIAAAVGYRALLVAKLRPAETVIVTGATGGTGACTVFCALACGAARVIAIARNQQRLEKLKTLAPRRIVTLSSTEFMKDEILKLTENHGA